VVNRHGRWYVAGYDTDREAARVFRLSRIEGEVGFTGPAGSVVVPEGTDVRETVREWDTQPPAQQRPAILRVRQGAGYGIRRYATPVSGSTGVPDSTGPGGWDTISVPFSDVGWFAEHLASFGTDVVALEPADLREAVITQLKGALA
jgi:proteasome accessory factor B